MVADSLISINHYEATNYLVNDDSLMALDEYLQRPVLIYNGLWSATDITRPTRCVFDIWSSTAGVANKLRGYQYFTGTLNIEVRYPGNPFTYGTALIAFHPCNVAGVFTNAWNVPEWVNNSTSHVGSAFSLPHAKIHAQDLSSHKLTLPVVDPRGYIDITLGEDWFIVTKIMSNLDTDAPTTLQPMPYQIYAWYTNIVLSGAIAIQSGEGNLVKDNKYFKLFKSLKDLNPLTTPWSTVLKNSGTLAENLGFSRPIVPTIYPVKTRAYSSLSNVSGEGFFGDNLRNSEMEVRDISGRLYPYVTQGEQDALDIAKKWSYSHTSSGNLIIANNPHYIIAEPDVPTVYSATATMQETTEMTNIMFASSMFTYWKGDLDFKIEFDCTVFTRAQIGIQILPVYSNVSTTFDPNIGYLTQVVDIVGRTVIDVKVPFVRPSFAQYISMNPKVATNSFSRIAIYLLSVQSADGNTTAIPYLVYVKAGDNYEISYPSLKSIAPYTTSYRAGSLVPQSTEMKRTGDHTTNLNQLMRKFCFNFEQTDGDDALYPLEPVMPSSNSTYAGSINISASRFTYQSYISSAFQQRSGGIRYVVFPFTTTGPAITTARTYATYNDMFTTEDIIVLSQGCSFQNTLNSGRIEVELPDRIPYQYRTRNSLTNASNIGTYYPGIAFHYYGGAVVLSRVLSAAADDYTVGGYLYPPILTVM